MDKTALRTAAEKYGTPLYLFDLEAFTARAQRVRAAFGSDVNLCYSMKANPFVLRGLPDVFRWVEVCSPGELTICEKLGIPPERILYSGVNKGADDVARAVALGADLLTAESTLHFALICAAAAAQAGIAHGLDDLVRLHLEQGLGQRAVAADGQVLLDGFRVDMAAVLKHAAGLLFVKRDVLLALIQLAVLVVAQALDELAAEDGLLDDLLHVADLALRVQPALRLDAHQRAHLAKAVAAGLLQADGIGMVLGQGHLARDAQLVHALFELMIDVQVAAGDTARAAADEDLALFRVARGHVVGLQGAELLQGFDSLTHYAPSFSRSSSMRSTALSGVMAGCTVSLTMTTGLRPHAPRHDTISMVNRPSSEVGLLSLRPVAS